MFSLSPLATVHHNILQHIRVRSSSKCYLTFNLTMASSSSFGSNSPYYVALLGLAFATPTPYGLSLHDKINSPTHYTKGTLSPPKEALTACRHSISVSISLPLSGFFSPFPHGTSSLSVIEEYLGLDELVHPYSNRITRVPLYSCLVTYITYTGLSPSMVNLSRLF